MSNFSTLPEKVQIHLSRLSASVSKVELKETKEWKIQTGSLEVNGPVPEIIGEVKEWREKNCLYVYTIRIVSRRDDLPTIHSQYLNAKSEKIGERAYAKVNPQSEWLYVGRSKNIHTRLRDHLGYGHKKTWAIHLAYWAASLDLELKFECAKYSPDTSQKALQLMEDTLWEELKPMLGKKGAKT